MQQFLWGPTAHTLANLSKLPLGNLLCNHDGNHSNCASFFGDIPITWSVRPQCTTMQMTKMSKDKNCQNGRLDTNIRVTRDIMKLSRKQRCAWNSSWCQLTGSRHTVLAAVHGPRLKTASRAQCDDKDHGWDNQSRFIASWYITTCKTGLRQDLRSRLS